MARPSATIIQGSSNSEQFTDLEKYLRNPCNTGQKTNGKVTVGALNQIKEAVETAITIVGPAFSNFVSFPQHFQYIFFFFVNHKKT